MRAPQRVPNTQCRSRDPPAPWEGPDIQFPRFGRQVQQETFRARRLSALALGALGRTNMRSWVCLCLSWFQTDRKRPLLVRQRRSLDDKGTGAFTFIFNITKGFLLRACSTPQLRSSNSVFQMCTPNRSASGTYTARVSSALLLPKRIQTSRATLAGWHQFLRC